MRIEVTAEHIRRGQTRTRYGNPVELALREATGEPWKANCQLLEAGWCNLDFPTPPHVAEFIIAFERFEEVQPMSIDLPEEWK